MNITENNTIAEIVTNNIKTAHIFKKYGLDFCCGGGISIKKACAKYNIEYNALEKDLLDVENVNNHAYNFDNWDLSFLIDHIINIHHKYVIDSIPMILEYANKVANVHGHHYTQVVEIKDLFIEVSNELLSHMNKEEGILFPYVKQLEKSKKEGLQLNLSHFGSVNNPINMMEEEHEKAGDIFKKIAKLSNNYTTPPEGCNTFKALYSKLEEFEQDLHQHIHLENNILFPKAIKLEAELV